MRVIPFFALAVAVPSDLERAHIGIAPPPPHWHSATTTTGSRWCGVRRLSHKEQFNLEFRQQLSIYVRAGVACTHHVAHHVAHHCVGVHHLAR